MRVINANFKNGRRAPMCKPTHNAFLNHSISEASYMSSSTGGVQNFVPLYGYFSNINYTKKQPNKISFRGTPAILPQKTIYDSSDAIYLYDCLKNGKYLDVHDDSYNPENKQIRVGNLFFLDRLYSTSDKKKFVDHYSNVTGFPDLLEVSKKIENEFINSIKKSSEEFYSVDYDCIAAGYDDTCSVGKRMALAGSDLDKAFVVLRGSDDFDLDIEIVNKFKEKLWNNTDQRILSYNHDTSFPTVVTLKQIKDQIFEISQKTQNVYFDKIEMEELVNNEYKNPELAAKYNILISDKFPRRIAHKKSSSKELSKEDVKNFGYLIESVKNGKKVISSWEYGALTDRIKDYDFFKYSNVAQMQAMKNAVSSGIEQKTKIIKRMKLEKEFIDWPVKEQYEFVKTLIKYSCEDQTDYEDYFKNDRDIKKLYKPLLAKLTKGNSDELYTPEFTKINNGVRMEYSKNGCVNLYSGYSPSVLWVDSSEKNSLERVLEDIDKIKIIKQFKNVKIIQCPKPDDYVEGFSPIKYYAKNGKQICEAKL